MASSELYFGTRTQTFEIVRQEIPLPTLLDNLGALSLAAIVDGSFSGDVTELVAVRATTAGSDGS